MSKGQIFHSTFSEYKDQYTDTIKLTINQKNYLAKGDFELSKVDLSTGEPVEFSLNDEF